MASSSDATRGRRLIFLASVLWSLNGFFPILTGQSTLGLHEPKVEPIHIAFYRALFAGLVLLPGIRRGEIVFRWPMAIAMICFAAMNISFVLAITENVASAMFLQYTAPAWTCLGGVLLLGEKPNQRSLVAVFIALTGVLLIVAGGWADNRLAGVALGLASGITYAGVLLAIRGLRGVSSRWITAVNLLTAAMVVLPFIIWWRISVPSVPQLLALLFFGGVQLGLPYFLMARGLRSVSAQEAGTITLIEPILSSFWAFLVDGQVPRWPTWVGGALILSALLYQYLPRGERAPQR